jgi:hypothetical protein
MEQDTDGVRWRIERLPARSRQEALLAAVGGDQRKALGAAIRRLRGARTQAEFGASIGLVCGEDDVPQTTISRWEGGLVDLSYEQVRVIEAALGVPTGTLAIEAGYVDLTAAPPPHLDEVKAFFFSHESDMRSCLKAAINLGLGVRVRNRRVYRDDDEASYEAAHLEPDLEWVLELLPDAPIET